MLQKLYQLFDSIASTPFIWDDEAYRLHVESVCMALGEYAGNEFSLKKKHHNWWVLTEHGNNATTGFTNMFDAVEVFISLQPRPDLV